MNEVVVRPPSAYLTPDWVLLGVPMADGTVTVFGSLTLTAAQLDFEIKRHMGSFEHFNTIGTVPGGKQTTRLSATMAAYAMANGPTYQAALVLLFSRWDADAQRGAAPASPLALGSS